MKMDKRSVMPLDLQAEGIDFDLTESEHAQVAQLAAMLAGMMDLAEDPRIEQAAYDLLRLFVVDGGMPVSRALETLGSSLMLTMTKMADQDYRH